MALRVVMLGAPGAGKGTQAQRIAAAHGLPHISTGDIFRARRGDGTELGRRIQKLLDAGQLVPDEITCEIVAQRLSEADCADGYILDGFPRSVPQAEALEQLLSAVGQRLTAAIEIEVPDEEIVGRLTARRMCERCGAIHNLKFDPPAGDGTVCDREGCGGALVQRADDREETIRERLRVYHEITKPLRGFYGERGQLYSVEGANAAPDVVYGKIESVLSMVESTE